MGGKYKLSMSSISWMKDFSVFNISINSDFWISFCGWIIPSISIISHSCISNSSFSFSFGLINMVSISSILFSGLFNSNKFIWSTFVIWIEFSSLIFPVNNILLIFSFFNSCFSFDLIIIFSPSDILRLSSENFLSNEIWIVSIFWEIFSGKSLPFINRLSACLISKEIGFGTSDISNLSIIWIKFSFDLSFLVPKIVIFSFGDSI